MSDSTFIETLEAGKLGDEETLEQLFTSFYDELHRRALRELRSGTPVTMGPTTLLHETFLNISKRESVTFGDPRRFMAYAARAMRGLIIDHFRSRRTQKRGGHLQITSLPTELPLSLEDAHSIDVGLLSDALDSLTVFDARLAECVDLRFFCGLTFAEIARLRDVSERTVLRDWDKARLLLHRFINDRDS